jgi:WD40 repeat protein
VTSLCVLPDGRLASGSDDAEIRLWDIATGVATTRLTGHTGAVRALCVLPDGRLASGSHDKTIRLWDVATGAETARLEGHSDFVRALRVLPDGRLAGGSDNYAIRLWDHERHGDCPSRGALGLGKRAVHATRWSARIGLQRQHDPAVGPDDWCRDRLPGGPFACCPRFVDVTRRASRLGLG